MVTWGKGGISGAEHDAFMKCNALKEAATSVSTLSCKVYDL